MTSFAGTLYFHEVSFWIAFHSATVPAKVMLVRLLQLEKAELPMVVTLFGMVTLVRLVQPEKALSSMLVTLSGIVMLVRLVQPLKTR